MNDLRNVFLGLFAALAAATAIAAPASAQQKPNVLIIMGDDIGYWNISAYDRGQMAYRTPSIDRITDEGPIVTDYYGQQSCSAGRAASARLVLGRPGAGKDSTSAVEQLARVIA